MINLWKEGFKTESYTIKSLSLLNEMELIILSDYVTNLVKKEGLEQVIDGETKTVYYFSLNMEKIEPLIKSKDSDFTEKLDEIQTVLVELLGDDVVKSYRPIDCILTIRDVQYEISVFKDTLKKK